MFIPRSPHFFFRNYCVVDLETTGLSSKRNEIIEVGILKIRDGKPSEQMDVLIRPSKMPIPVFIESLTGIRSSMLESAPSIQEVEYWIWEFIGSDPIVGYNVLFDLRFLNVHTRKHTPFPNEFADVLDLARICFPQLKSHSLSSMTAYLHLYQNTHRALDDCAATYQLYEICMEKLQSFSDEQIRDMIEQNRQMRRQRRLHDQQNRSES